MQNKIYGSFGCDTVPQLMYQPSSPALFTLGSQAQNLALIFFAATLTWSLVMFYSDHRQVFTPIYQ